MSLCVPQSSIKHSGNLCGNMHVQSKIYLEFYHGIEYIANE
jgi:hypothetical protein